MCGCCQDGHGGHVSAHRANFRDADLVLAQVLEQKGLEGLVSAVHLVNQQHRTGRRRLQRLQKRPSYQVAVLVHLALDIGRTSLTAADGPPQGGGRPLGGQRGHASAERGGSQFDGTHVQQLGCVIPFVERLALLQPVVTLQADQLALQRQGQRLGQFGLADARLAFEQQRSLQFERQEHGSRQAPVGKVTGVLQSLRQGVYGGERCHRISLVLPAAAIFFIAAHAHQQWAGGTFCS